ncbi:MAG: lytic murein transglycosylase [Candidatus Kaiserbacteria bacterium]|nr:MAG: lytic murein transglycosylase [Candidatus Kaiserbacteria bacterium]
MLFLSALPLSLGAQVQDAAERARLQAELDQIERDIANNKGTLSELQKKRTSLERDISILDNKIKTAQLQIKQTDLALKQLQGGISEKQSAIRELDAKALRSEESLAQILRRTREIDDLTIVELALGGSLSDLFQDIDNFEAIQRSLDVSFAQISALREDLSGRKQALEEEEDEAQKVRTAQVLAKQAVERDEKEKQGILTATKGVEKSYEQIIAQKQRQADAIRAALFGLRDSEAIPFGTAYEYAKAASASTGVRPALVLAILTQESDLGVNVGSCYVTNLLTGGGVGKNTGRAISNVMKAPRDTTPFQTITEALGRDWSNTPVSCPQGSGYGGAMGPAQFIPSTWMLYKTRLAAASGETFPNPWNARTAVFATAFLMKDNGADEGTRTAERRAALKYFAGANWNKAANARYGDSVMEHVDEIQAEIDILEGR